MIVLEHLVVEDCSAELYVQCASGLPIGTPLPPVASLFAVCGHLRDWDQRKGAVFALDFETAFPSTAEFIEMEAYYTAVRAWTNLNCDYLRINRVNLPDSLIKCTTPTDDVGVKKADLYNFEKVLEFMGYGFTVVNYQDVCSGFCYV